MNEKLGEVAYNAYCEQREWKSLNGDPLPNWKQQDEKLRAAWSAAVNAVVAELLSSSTKG